MDIFYWIVPSMTLVLLLFFAYLLFKLFDYLLEKYAEPHQRVEAKSPLPESITKCATNPVLSPTSFSWEANGAFNPAVLYLGDRIHLLYRAVGQDGISRIGYASSSDGINFDVRLPYPVYEPKGKYEIASPDQVAKPRQKFDKNYRSGGGWCGCEDPRAVYVPEDNKIYLSYVAFAGWDSIRIGVTSITLEDFLAQKWNWSRVVYVTKPGVIAKSGLLFPERINGELLLTYRVFHNDISPPTPRTHFARFRSIDARTIPADPDIDPYIEPEQNPAIKRWYSGKPSFGSPPIKTRLGWLIIQTAVAGRHEWPGSDLSCYRVGVILLDLDDPTKVLHQSTWPLIEPTEWYENDWKPGIVYCCGAVVKNDTLMIYYGGGDKHTALATADFNEFINLLEEEMNQKSE